MIKIESKFIAESESLVIQHRRLVTPFFYIKLKSIEYNHFKDEKVVAWTFAEFWIYKKTGWRNDKDEWIDRGYNKKQDMLVDQLDLAASEFKRSNVVQFRKNTG